MPTQTKKLIFVIEDDESVRKLLERALASKYQVEAFGDGFAVLKRVEKPPMADLFICDVMLPGMDGLTIAKKLKGIPGAKNVPLVFLTAKTTPLDVIHGIQAGARHYVTKPFKLDDLMQKIDKILRG